MLRALTNIARFKFIFCYIVKYTVFKWTNAHIRWYCFWIFMNICVSIITSYTA